MSRNSNFKFTVLLFVFVSVLFSFRGFSQINVNALINDAQSDYSKGNFLEAIKKLNICISVNPSSAVAYFFRGISKYSLNDNLGAEQDLSNAISIYNPWVLDAYHYRALARIRLEEFSYAIQDLDKVIVKQDNDPQLYIERAVAKLSAQDYKGVIADCNKALSFGAAGDNLFLFRGSAESALNLNEEAMRDFEKALKINPKNVDVYVRMGATQAKMGNQAAALVDFNTAIKLDSACTLAYYYRAESEESSNEQSKAFTDYSVVLKYEPLNALVYFNRAVLQANMKLYKNAIADFDKVLELNPKNIQATFNRARLRAVLSDYKGALQDYNHTIEAFPYYVEAYYDRSEVKKNLKDFEGAKKDLELSKIIGDMNREKNISQRTTDSASLVRLMELDADFGNGGTHVADTVSITLMPLFYIALKDSGSKKSVFFSPLLLKLGNEHQSFCFTDRQWKPLSSDSLKENSSKEKGSPLWEAIQKTNMQLFSEAIVAYTRLIEQNPKSAVAYFARGLNSCKEAELIRQFDAKNANEKYEKALQDFSKAVQLEPSFAFAYYDRAYVRCQLQDFNGAEKDCGLCIQADQYIADAYFNRGLLLLYMRDKLNACENFSKASELGLVESYAIIKKYCNHLK